MTPTSTSHVPNAAPAVCHPAKPVIPQKPREFCFLLLKGCATRWEDKEAIAQSELNRLRADGVPFRAFRYAHDLQSYVEWFGLDRSVREVPALD